MNNFSLTQIVQDVKDGNENPLIAYANLNSYIKEAKKCLEEIKEEAVIEALKHPKKSFNEGDYAFTLNEGRANYNFDNIPGYKEAKKIVKEIEAKAKISFNSYKNGLNTADENGEIIPLPTVTYSKESISCKFVKK